ncbi:MAG: M13 family metallopeptidase [Chloroflexota bacterium]
MRFEHDCQLGLEQPVDREWAMPAHIVNAYYHPLLNEIVFPAGILQPPFFYADADAVNYGAIGTVIGHDITHGFDDQGCHFDGAGRKRDWWTEADRAEFERLAGRSRGPVRPVRGCTEGAKVNGRLTLGENIADLGGVAIVGRTALRCPRDPPIVEGSTPEQRFFLAYATMCSPHDRGACPMFVNADPHAPAQFRVNGPLSNVPAFAAAFGVAEGTLMARVAEDRVRIW